MGRIARAGLLAAAAAFAAALCQASALAQATVGELLDAGGQRLGQREALALLSGATLRGVSRFGVRFEIHNAEDGRYRGVAGARGERLAGRWWVDADGLYCTEVGTGAHRGETSCSAWFRRGRSIFASDADGARDAPLRARQVLRRTPAATSPAPSAPRGAMRQFRP